jgi:tryptophan synthase alpha chain
MSRIGDRFAELKKTGSVALIPYITAGDPDLETTRLLAAAMERNGADIIELGVPFSDPLADGTTIQRASHRSLERGVSLSAILQTAARIRAESSIPLVLMSYFNPILRHGLERFVDDAAASGVDGLIVPDLPPDEAAAERFLIIARPRDFDIIFLLAPTSTKERIELVARYTSGFIYCVSLTGVTGARRRMSADLSAFLGTVRARTDTPLAVGFGISTPQQAKTAARHADGVIVGSAIVEIIEKTEHIDKIEESVGTFVKDLKSSIQEGD